MNDDTMNPNTDEEATEEAAGGEENTEAETTTE